MIKNISYYKPNIVAEIVNIVGKEHSFWEKLKQKGSNSERFIICKASRDIKKHLVRAHNINFAIVKRRKAGIVINFTSVVNEYAWVIPFDKLLIKNSGNTFDFISGKESIRVSSKLLTNNHIRFIEQIILDQKEFIQKN